jgi:hypothetical protein
MSNFNFNLWYETYDPIFTEICHKSLIPEKWINYQAISHDIFKKNLIKPINRYVEFLYPKPELISINSNEIILRQRNHAEIFLLKEDKNFKNVDRPWMRQYYQTKDNFKTNSECFEEPYLFYIPWFFDFNVNIKIKNSKESSPFEIKEKEILYKKVPESSQYIEPEFVLFKFKKNGNHMLNEDFGKIPIGSPMFDIVLAADDILIEKIKDIYECN